MAKRRPTTCDDCYFRQAGLCALGDGPCPTFRPAMAHLAPPQQPRLVVRAEPRTAHAAA